MTPYPAIWLFIWAKMITIIMAINQKMFVATNILLTKRTKKFWREQPARPRNTKRQRHKKNAKRNNKGRRSPSRPVWSEFHRRVFFTSRTQMWEFLRSPCLHFLEEMLIIAFTEPTSGRPGAPRLCDVTDGGAAPFDADQELLLRDASVAPPPNWERAAGERRSLRSATSQRHNFEHATAWLLHLTKGPPISSSREGGVSMEGRGGTQN